jgi:transposase
MFSYISAEQRVPQGHPLRALRTMVDEALAELSPRFSRLYAKRGRPSIAPEKLLRALLLQVLYTIRSERQLMEQLDYNLLFRWFVGLNMDDRMWDVTVFTKNRERLLKGNIAQAFFQKVLEQARERSLLSEEHFTVDGTLIEAWAGQKSFQRKDKSSPPPQDGGQQSDGELPWPGTPQSDASIHDRPRVDAVSKVGRQRIQVELHGACIDGESQRAGGGHAAHPSDWNGGARCCAGHGSTDSRRHQACDAGWGQELRYARFRE